MGSPAHDLVASTLHLPYDFTGFSSCPSDSWASMEDMKPPRGLPSMPERGLQGVYLSRLDMYLSEDTAWLLKRADVACPLVPCVRDHNHDPDHEAPHRKEPEQCPVIDSQGGLGGLSPELEGQVEERCLEQVQSLVVGEVLKDIETACKLLNITPGTIRSRM